MSEQETLRVEKRGPPSADALPPALLRCHPLGEPPSMQLHVLDRPLVLLGRSAECNIQLEDERVSRRHALLACRDSKNRLWHLSDCGSANGIFVNGVQVRETVLGGGELIRIGSAIFRFLREGLAPRVTSYELPTSGMLTGPTFSPIHEVLDRAASSNLTVLVTGETGTGKELAALHLHRAGNRAQGPFVPVNCSALPPQLIESELFGHVKGAFTGAAADRPGLVRQAEGGTLFLDEIGEMPLDCQAKLLRILQERMVRPVGGTRSFGVDLRVVSATNRPLLPWVQEGRFRADLYARIAELVVLLPPLRERSEDVPLLVQNFLVRHGAPGRRVSVEAMEQLCCRTWPFNIRQLESSVRRALLLAGEARELGPEHFVEPESSPPAPSCLAHPPTPSGPTADSTDANALREVLSRCHGDPEKAAAELQISRSQLYRRAQKLGVRLGDFRS